MKVLAIVSTFIVAVAGCGHALWSQEPVSHSMQTLQRSDQASRLRVRQSRRPKVTMPSASALVSTAQSGASRTTDPPRILGNVQVVGRDGKPQPLRASAPTGHWVLLYRSPVCVACDRLMKALSGDGNPDTATVAHLTVLVGTQPGVTQPVGHATKHAITVGDQHAELDRVHATFTALDHATWVYDRNGDAWTALKPGGSPTMYGMDGERIVWRAAGAPGGTAGLQQRVAQWVGSSAANPDSQSSPVKRP